jgi:hypothetical protein
MHTGSRLRSEKLFRKPAMMCIWEKMTNSRNAKTEIDQMLDKEASRKFKNPFAHVQKELM